MKKWTRFHKEVIPNIWEIKRMMRNNYMEIYRVDYQWAKCTSVAKIKRFIKNSHRS